LPILSKTTIQAKLSQRFREFKAQLGGPQIARQKLMVNSPTDPYSSGGNRESSNSKVSSVSGANYRINSATSNRQSQQIPGGQKLNFDF
jgi:hypothetical protein